MYWMQKLMLYRMDDEDVEKHVDAMIVIHEHLTALVTVENPLTANDIFATVENPLTADNIFATVENPLTADDIFATALLIAVPTTWLHCVSHLLNSAQALPTQMVACLKAEANRRASTVDYISSVTVSKAAVSDCHNRPSPRRFTYNKDAFCSFCKTSGHDLSSCKTAARVLSDHTKTAAEDLKKLKGGNRSFNGSKHTRASRTQAVPLKFGVDKHDSPTSEDSSSSEAEVKASRANHGSCQ